MIPRQRSSEFFGFFGVFEKFAAIVGPAVFAITVRRPDRAATRSCSVIVFFVIGALLLWKVDVEEGKRVAAEMTMGR